jgi:MFS family permease
MIPHGLLISATVGMGIACIQEIVPSDYRGIASALLLFSQNLIGLGLGPVCIGLMNDYVFCDPTGIGKSLMTVSVTCLIITVIIFKRALSINKNRNLQRI